VIEVGKRVKFLGFRGDGIKGNVGVEGTVRKNDGGYPYSVDWDSPVNPEITMAKDYPMFSDEIEEIKS